MTDLKNSEQNDKYDPLTERALNLIHKIAITDAFSRRTSELVIGGCRKFLIDEGFWKDEK